MSLYKHVLAKEQQLVQPITKWLPVHSSYYTFSNSVPNNKQYIVQYEDLVMACGNESIHLIIYHT